MKQHITRKQLKSITRKDLVKLGYTKLVSTQKEIADSLISKQMDIGFMIEFLRLNYPYKRITIVYQPEVSSDECDSSQWIVNIGSNLSSDSQLVNALWKLIVKHLRLVDVPSLGFQKLGLGQFSSSPR